METINWDERFSSDEYIFGIEPDPFLVSQENRLKPGMRALSVGDGEGRNGIWLASKGLNVLSLDISHIALKKATNLAWQRQLPLGILCTDVTTWPWPKDRYDVITLIYVHFASNIRRQVYKNMYEALLPGGYIILKVFHPKQLEYSSGGPDNIDFLVTIEDLKNDFPQANIQYLEELEIEKILPTKDSSSEMAVVSLMVAKRPF